jgi:C4-dicarboxylate-binding protein DctP
MSIVDVALLNNLYEPSQVLFSPGMFNSVEECDAILDGDWGAKFKADFERQTGIRILSLHCKGFRNFTTSNKELRRAADAKGVTFRVQESPVSIKMVEALGAKAVPMPGSEMYVAMANGVVDGQENPVLNIIQDKTYEVQKYLVLDGHMPGIMAYIINGELYASPPDHLKTAVNEAADIATPEAKKVVENKNRDGIQILRNYGMSVYEPTAEEIEEWHSTMFEPVQVYMRSILGEATVNDLLNAIKARRGA